MWDRTREENRDRRVHRMSDVETQADFELDFQESERKEKRRRINGVREMEELLKENETRRRNTAKSWRRNGSRRIIEVKG